MTFKPLTIQLPSTPTSPLTQPKNLLFLGIPTQHKKKITHWEFFFLISASPKKLQYNQKKKNLPKTGSNSQN